MKPTTLRECSRRNVSVLHGEQTSGSQPRGSLCRHMDTPCAIAREATAPEQDYFCHLHGSHSRTVLQEPQDLCVTDLSAAWEHLLQVGNQSMALAQPSTTAFHNKTSLDFKAKRASKQIPGVLYNPSQPDKLIAL